MVPMVWLDEAMEGEMVGTEVLALLPMSTNWKSLLDVLEEGEEADSEIATIVGIIPAPAWNTTSATVPVNPLGPPAYCPV